MSAARARRRLMAFERYRRRALLLDLPYRVMSKTHRNLMHRVNDSIPGHGWAWTLPDPPLKRRRPR